MAVVAKGPVHIELGDAIFLVNVERHFFSGPLERLRIRGAHDFLAIHPDRIAAVAGYFDGSVNIVNVERPIAGVRKYVVNGFAGFTRQVAVRGINNARRERERTYCDS
jgi:hypothetical protein